MDSEPSLEGADCRLKELFEKAPSDCVIVAVGNKIDVKENRFISTEEAIKHFHLYEEEGRSVPYFETSAKTGVGVSELFKGVLRLWVQNGGPARLLQQQQQKKRPKVKGTKEQKSSEGLFGMFKKTLNRRKEEPQAKKGVTKAYVFQALKGNDTPKIILVGPSGCGSKTSMVSYLMTGRPKEVNDPTVLDVYEWHFQVDKRYFNVNLIGLFCQITLLFLLIYVWVFMVLL